MIDFNITETSFEISYDNANRKAIFPNVKIPFTPFDNSSSNNTNFYYRITYPDDQNNSKEFGPYTITEINNNTITNENAKYIILDSSFVRDLVTVNCQSETEIHFDIYISTGNNNFSLDSTIQKRVTVFINNFCFLKILNSKYESRKYDANTNRIKISYICAIKYAKSYGDLALFQSNETIILDESKTQDISTELCSYEFLRNDNTNLNYRVMQVKYVYEWDTTITSSFPGFFDFIKNATLPTYLVVTDGVQTVHSHKTAVLPDDFDRNIYLYQKSTSDSNSKITTVGCEALELIEDNNFNGFSKYGDIYAAKFVETNTESYIGNVMEFGEFYEKPIAYNYFLN